MATPLLVLLGMILPARTTGRLYLVRALQKRGVDRNALPKPCLQALADKAIEQAKGVATLTRQYWRARLPGDLDALAWSVAAILRPENNKWGEEINAEAELRYLLLGFGVDLPPRPKTWRRLN